MSRAALRKQHAYRYINPKVVDPKFTYDDSPYSNLSFSICINAIAELVLLRFHAKRCWISLTDGETQYIIGGVSRDGNGKVVDDPTWYGRKFIDFRDNFCQETLDTTAYEKDCLCYVVGDMTEHPVSRDAPWLNEELEAPLRFYAAAPIITESDIEIGTIAVVDDKARSNTLDKPDQEYFRTKANDIMRHLELTREAAERGRVNRMVKGLASFIEGRATVTPSTKLYYPRRSSKVLQTETGHYVGSTMKASPLPERQQQALTSGAQSEIDIALDRAAHVLLESLDAKEGGVVFIDMGNSNVSSTLKRETTTRDHSPGNESVLPNLQDVLAISIAQETEKQVKFRSMDERTLKWITKSYPKGNLWVFDSNNDQCIEILNTPDISQRTNRTGLNTDENAPDEGSRDLAIFQGEILLDFFPDARQIMFFPLWDAQESQNYCGMFFFTKSAYPVLTVKSELAYLAAYGDSVMAEISRLVVVASDNIKSDFISSISHEFRSPLHGILGSAELMEETGLNHIQRGLIETVQSCGQTLLETVEHLLDYSKITSFVSNRRQRNRFVKAKGDAKLPGLLAKVNVASLIENVVENVTGGTNTWNIARATSSAVKSPVTPGDEGTSNQVSIILDLKQADWVFVVQPHAIQQIASNIFTNAMKYTTNGSIVVKAFLKTVTQDDTTRVKTWILVFEVTDTGHGISPSYLSRKLYGPFSQENSLLPGNGLGLSIVKNIVDSLEGHIHVQSKLREGTRVLVEIPLTRTVSWNESDQFDDDKITPTLDRIKQALQLSAGKTIAICKTTTENGTSYQVTLQCLKQYLEGWLELKILFFDPRAPVPQADFVIVDESDYQIGLPIYTDFNPKILLQSRDSSMPTAVNEKDNVEILFKPVGPQRLASALIAVSDNTRLNVKSGAVEKDTIHFNCNNSGVSQVESEITNLQIRTDDMSRHQGGEDGRDQKAVLIVEDNAINLKILRTFLARKSTVKIDEAENGLLAVEKVQLRPQGYDLIFMDLSMPVMDGFEATRQIRKLEEGRGGGVSHIVALTGLTAEESQLRAKDSGVDQYLKKPLPFKKVQELLSSRDLIS